eukprot:COSAG01_NODE_18821_length_1051_cov_0.813025_1_plen_250_part_10
MTAVLRLLASPDVIAALGSPVARKARCLLREYWGRDRGRMPEPESEPGLPPRGHGTGAPSQCGEAEVEEEEEEEELRRLNRRRRQHLQGLRCRRALLSSRQRQLTVAQCRQQEEGAEVGLVHDPRQSATDDVAAEHRWRMLRASEAVLARQQQPLGAWGGSGTVRGAMPLHAQAAVVAARESAACLRSERDALRARVEAQAAVVDQERREHTATVAELRASTEERVVEERRAHYMAVAQLEAEAVAATEA